MASKSKLFLVLTTGRAGSSATAGTLSHLGIHMGDRLVGANPTNPKGHYENADFLEMNERIFRSINASLVTLPSREELLASPFPRNDLSTFLQTQVKPIWGLKDPRTTLTLELWKPHLEEIAHITYIFAWRPIEECINSVVKGYKWDRSTAQALVEHSYANLTYFRETLEKENNDIIDTHFHSFLENPEVFVQQINQRLDQEGHTNLEIVKEFLDRKLKHFLYEY